MPQAELFEEQAPAKINLTLRVLGRRPDGYHAIESLVVFARYGDRLTLRAGNRTSFSATGPFAAEIVGANLVEAAAEKLLQTTAGLRLGDIALEKNLPVAAGLGGGSADAAALLRAVRRANPHAVSVIDWHSVAQTLGADVPVCLHGAPALMWGIGDRIIALPAVPRAAIVLANPRLPVAAADVYRQLRSGPAPRALDAPLPPPAFRSVYDLVGYAAARGNDLEREAITLCPQIGEVKSALAAQPGALITRMSGSGATCFALFATAAEADAAAAAILARQPAWWVLATELAS